MHEVLIVLYLSQEKGYVLSLYSVIVLKKDSIFAIPNITYNSEPVSISVVGIFMSTAVRDMRFRTPVGSINVLPAYVIREC